MHPVVDPERYRSFLLRQWKEGPDASWRYQVRCVATGDEHRFGDLEHLLAFLRDEATAGNELELDWSGRPRAARGSQAPFP